MKVHEIITEAKVEASKPRNFVAKNAKMGGAGQHKDKKKAEKQGDVKHKNKQFSEGLAEDPNSVPQDWQEWNVMIMNNFYSGRYPDYSARYYSVVASSPEEAREVVLNNSEKVLRDLLARKTKDGKRVLPPKSALPIEDKRVGGADRIKPGSVTTMGFKEMLTPSGPMMLKFASGKIVDVQGKEGVAEASIPYALSAANYNAEFERQHKNRTSSMPAGGGYRGRVELDVESKEDYIATGRALKKAADAAGQHIEYGLSGGVMKVFSDSMSTDELDTFIDDTLENFDQGVAEGSVKELSMDLRTLSDAEFQAQYKMTKAQARAGLQGKAAVKETATAGSTSAGNVAVGAVYKNKKAKMQKPGTNALDMKGTNLLTGGSIKR